MLILTIGGIKIDPPVVLAPLAGVSDIAFRYLARRFGCGLVVSEMISAKGLIYGNLRTREMLAIKQAERPTSIQIFGSEPTVMAEAAQIVEAAGADIIDINCGCPVAKIVNNGEGAALLHNPLLAGKVVAAVVAAVGVPVTVKMRLGWDKDNINAKYFAQTAEAAGASAIVVHGRTREQFYSGRADWQAISQVKRVLSVPVIGNGDIVDSDMAWRRLTDGSCDGIMIGRAAQGNPWIFRDIARRLAGKLDVTPASWQERCEIAMEHFDSLVANKGEHVAVREMRTHAAHYLRGLYGAARMRDRVHAAKTRKCYEAIFDVDRSGFRNL